MARRGSERQAVAADYRVADAREEPVARLGSFVDRGGYALLDPHPHRRRNLVANAVPVQHGGCFEEGRWIGRGRAGADHVRIVADHVGNQQRFHLRRPCQARQSPALDCRQMFANGVDFMDVCAARQQQPRDFLLFRQRDRRRRQRQQRRGAARNQAQHQVANTSRGGDLRDALRAGCAALVRHRVSAFVQLDAAQLGDVAVLDVHQAAGDNPPQRALGGARHGSARLARADHVNVAEAGIIAPRQVAHHRLVRVGRPQRGAKNGGSLMSQQAVSHRKNGCARMASATASASSVSMGMWTSASR